MVQSQLELEQSESSEKEQQYSKPENYSSANKYTLYRNGDNILHIANSWSRKSINRVLGKDNDDGLLWALNNKCQYQLIDEFDILYDTTADGTALDTVSIENIPIDTIAWLNEVMVNHIGFLVEASQMVRK